MVWVLLMMLAELPCFVNERVAFTAKLHGRIALWRRMARWRECWGGMGAAIGAPVSQSAWASEAAEYEPAESSSEERQTTAPMWPGTRPAAAA